MQFKPLSAKEVEERLKLPKGDFPATVISAENAMSKKEVEMIKLSVQVFVGDRKLHFTDYLHPAMEVKVRHFCECAGLMDQYECGSLTAEMCEGKDITVKLGIKKQEGFADKSEIRDYVPERKAATPPSTLKPDPADDIPGVGLPF